MHAAASLNAKLLDHIPLNIEAQVLKGRIQFETTRAFPQHSPVQRKKSDGMLECFRPTMSQQVRMGYVDAVHVLEVRGCIGF